MMCQYTYPPPTHRDSEEVSPPQLPLEQSSLHRVHVQSSVVVPDHRVQGPRDGPDPVIRVAVELTVHGVAPQFVVHLTVLLRRLRK